MAKNYYGPGSTGAKKPTNYYGPTQFSQGPVSGGSGYLNFYNQAGASVNPRTGQSWASGGGGTTGSGGGGYQTHYWDPDTRTVGPRPQANETAVGNYGSGTYPGTNSGLPGEDQLQRARNELEGHLKRNQNFYGNNESQILQGQLGRRATGQDQPFDQATIDRLFSRQTDAIEGGVQSGLEQSRRRFGASGLGGSGGQLSQELGITQRGNTQKRGAMSDILNTAQVQNFGARERAQQAMANFLAQRAGHLQGATGQLADFFSRFETTGDAGLNPLLGLLARGGFGGLGGTANGALGRGFSMGLGTPGSETQGPGGLFYQQNRDGTRDYGAGYRRGGPTAPQQAAAPPPQLGGMGGSSGGLGGLLGGLPAIGGTISGYGGLGGQIGSGQLAAIATAAGIPGAGGLAGQIGQGGFANMVPGGFLGGGYYQPPDQWAQSSQPAWGPVSYPGDPYIHWSDPAYVRPRG